jgi:hypothetical protein
MKLPKSPISAEGWEAMRQHATAVMQTKINLRLADGRPIQLGPTPEQAEQMIKDAQTRSRKFVRGM